LLRTLALALLALLPPAAARLLELAAAQSPSAVEQLYSRGAYPPVAGWLAAASARLPVAAAELLAALLALLWLLWLVRARGWRRRLAALVWPPLLLAGFGYAAFVALWGLNHRRQPFAESHSLAVRPSSVAELADLAEALLAEAGALREGLPEDADGAVRLADGRSGALGRVAAGLRAAGFPPPPDLALKLPLASPILSRLGVSGIYVPFTAEPLVNGTLPDSALPFSASHEAAHLLGWAREDEANYVAARACRRHPDRDFRYSGAFESLGYALGALAARDRPAYHRLRERYTKAMERDVAAESAWRARYAGRLERVARRTNDAYLRSMGSADGVHSYGRMVDLLLAERRAAARVRLSALPRRQRMGALEEGSHERAAGPDLRPAGGDRVRGRHDAARPHLPAHGGFAAHRPHPPGGVAERRDRVLPLFAGGDRDLLPREQA
jgi:hypothetical protein